MLRRFIHAWLAVAFLAAGLAHADGLQVRRPPLAKPFTGPGAWVAGRPVIRLRGSGGGGGHGPGQARPNSAGGRGGGPGARSSLYPLPVTPGATLTITVGAAVANGK